MIHLIDNYYAKPFMGGYALQIVTGKIDKDGQPVYKEAGYYTSLESVVEGCIKHRVKAKLTIGNHELKEAVRMIRESREELAGLIREVKDQ